LLAPCIDLPETFLERSVAQHTYAAVVGKMGQAIFCRRRRQPKRPPPAKISPGKSGIGEWDIEGDDLRLPTLSRAQHQGSR